MPMIPADILDRLQRQLDEENLNLATSNDIYGHSVDYIEDEGVDSVSPIMDRFMDEGNGNQSLISLTNFSFPEFSTIWTFIETELTVIWTCGRGRKPTISAKDAFFITLVVLKHFDTWAKHAIDFGLQPSSLEKSVHRVISTVEPILYMRFVREISMETLKNDGTVFTNYPYALYATDVKFQPSYRPSGRFQEQKEYFSAKHKLYGHKIECSVAPNGLAVDISEHFPGSKSDLTIFLDRASRHRNMLKKADDEEVDVGERSREFPRSWAVLVDKGYQGAGQVIRTIQPKKQPRGGQLDHEDLSRNRLVSSDRVIVENFFGRMCQLWFCCYSTYKWNEVRYDSMTRLCVALTNYHITLMPLRSQDENHYKCVLSRYQSMAHKVRTSRARIQREYRLNRRIRTEQPFYNSRDQSVYSPSSQN